MAPAILLHPALAQAGGLALFSGGMLIFMILGLLATIFWLWMLIDALMNEPSGTEKIVWVLVIFFLHFLGALIYFFMRRSNRTTGPIT